MVLGERVSRQGYISKRIYRAALVIYILGTAYLAYLTVRSFLSPYHVYYAPEAGEMQNECVQSAAFPNCMYDIIEYDFTYVWGYHGLAYHYHDWVAGPAWSEGRIGAALVAETRYLWNLHLFYLLFWSTLPYLLGWTILFGYLLLYHRIANYPYKWIEALITGYGTAGLLWFVDRYQALLRPDDALPPSLISFIVIYLLTWFAPDIWFQRIDNFIAKAILLVGTLTAFAIFPFDQNVKLITVPFFTFALALGYGYWRTIEDQRRQIAVLIYTTLIVGVGAAVVKHWKFFTSGIFTGQYEQAGLGELVNDFIIFFLGFLLTYLELGSEEKEIGTIELEPRQTPSVPLAQMPVPVQDTRKQTVIVSALVGVLAGVLGILYVRSFSVRKAVKNDD